MNLQRPKRQGSRRLRERRAFLLLLVLVVVSMAALAALTFSKAMLTAHEVGLISGKRFQARMCAESGLQVVRLFVAQPEASRLELGGAWENDMFYARNVIPDLSAEQRGNFSIMAPALDNFGSYSGIRFGLQNESAKLNLNALSQLDALASSGDLGSAAAGGDTGVLGDLASEATESVGSDLAVNMLLALPGMTIDIADSILDWLDEDDIPREYGAEFDDYYSTLPSPYRPKNGPINSIEQLLLIRGVTPQLLFGYDTDRNGVLSQDEEAQMGIGGQATSGGESTSAGPPPLGWGAYLTVHSMEKNVTRYGEPRVNINSDDLATLYDDLVVVLGDEMVASFIVAYRQFGAPGGGGTSPLITLGQMAAEDADPDGALGAELEAISSLSNAGQADQAGGAPPQPWSADMLASVDLTQSGSVKFNQVLDLFDATVTMQQGNSQVVYASPYTSDPGALALATPLLMDALTTVDAPGVPGRINIMECPQEILRGIPGLSDDIVDQILEARVDGSESETRFFETWLAVEGYVTMEEMRAILPLVTCGGDVFKAQIVGYMEGSAMSGRIEAIVSPVEDVPKVLFFRRLDRLGRGADVTTLGQRFDATVPGGSF